MTSGVQEGANGQYTGSTQSTSTPLRSRAAALACRILVAAVTSWHRRHRLWHFGLVWPGLTLLTLIFLWGAYAIVDGALALWEAIAGRRSEIAPRWWLAVVGIAGILAGLMAFAWPGLTALVLLVFIATWAIVIGLLQIWGAIRLRKEIEGEWLLIVSGLLSVVFGIVLLVQPGTGALALVWLIAWFSILVGCLYIVLAFRLRKHAG
jgi:uncharacterized membrane protein HdeD (DUF308 family)